MSASAKTAAESEQDTQRKTSPSSTESPSTCSNKTNPQSEESRENDSTPPGTTLTSSNYSESDMRRPCPHKAMTSFRQSVPFKAQPTVHSCRLRFSTVVDQGSLSAKMNSPAMNWTLATPDKGRCAPSFQPPLRPQD